MDNLKIAQLTRLLTKSQNFNHIFGTTQTNTNYLDSSGEVEGKEVGKTSRGSHCQMVASCAKTLVEKVFSDENTRNKISEVYGKEELSDENFNKKYELANIIGLSHDIGHCLYGHDGEASLDSIMRAQGAQESVAGFRAKYYGMAQDGKTPIKDSYEEQQRMQNYLTGDNSSEKGYVFDHGEQSAEAFINICEANGIDIHDPDIQEIAQGILFHSRPAFQMKSLASQAVMISDSMAFIQDDYNQMIAFDKISAKQARKISEAGGLTEDFMNMTGAERLLNAQREVIENFKKTGKMQNGQHIVDQMWYVDKLKARINPANSNHLKIETQQQLDELCQTIEHFGIKLPAGDDAFKLEDFKAQTINGKDGKEIQEFAIEKKLNDLKLKLDKEFETNFPFNYKCRTMHQLVSHNLIMKQRVGNNQSEDRAYAQFIMSNFVNDVKKIKGKDLSEYVNQKSTFKDSAETLFQTDSFKKLKECLEKASENPESILLTGMSELKKMGGKSLSNEDVLKCIGFNFKSLDSAGILDDCTPMQIIAKVSEGLTNNFSRFYARDMVKNMSQEKLNEIMISDDKQKKDAENWWNAGVSSVADKTAKFTAKGLIYLGFKKEQIIATGKVDEAEYNKAAKKILEEEIKQKLALRHENKDFDHTLILNLSGVDDQQIKDWQSDLVEEIVQRLPKTDESIDKQNEALNASNDTEEAINKIDEQIKEIERSFENDKDLILGISYISMQEYNVSEENFKDLEQLIPNLVETVKKVDVTSDKICELVSKIIKVQDRYKNLLEEKRKLVEKIDLSEVSAEREKMGSKEEEAIKQQEIQRQIESRAKEKEAAKNMPENSNEKSAQQTFTD